MRTHTLLNLGAFVLCVAGVGAITACSANSEGGGFGITSGSGGGDSSGSGEGGLNFTTSAGVGGGGASGPLTQEPDCPSQDADPTNSMDVDMDGQTAADGDCNDCTWQMNSGAADYPGNNIDEDCNGANDDTPVGCDAALALDSSDPMDGVRAMDLCKMSNGVGWGVVSAEYVTSDGLPLPDPMGHGILDNFGPSVNVQQGSKMLVLSSGTARRPSDAGYQGVGGYDKGYTSGSPPGYPKESPSCPGVITGEPHDSAALRVAIKTPTNAKSFSFNLDFYTYEFPVYTCSAYNDFFVAMLSPVPSGQVDGNISFDSQGNTISVNAGFLEVCTPQMAGGKNFPCALGTAQLVGTGYDDSPGNSAATSWLQTTSPLENPGEQIELLFAIWDSGDGILDSTILLDNLRFDVEEAPTQTAPVPEPK